MKRKIVMLALVAVLALSACGRSNRVKNNGGNKSTSAENINGQESGNVFKTKSYKSARDVEGVSDKYVDFDNMSFVYHGKLYTLGKSTLQDLIDDGTTEFTEPEKARFDEMLEPGGESSIPFYLDPSAEMQLINEGIWVTVYNPTDKSLAQRDCVLSSMAFQLLLDDQNKYRDVGDFKDVFTDEEANKQLEHDIDILNDEIRFSFPLTLQEDDLTERFPEFEREYEFGFNRILYMKSEDLKFGYKFEFDKNKDNRDQVFEVHIYWLPQ